MAAENEPTAMPLRGTALLSSKQWSQGVFTSAAAPSARGLTRVYAFADVAVEDRGRASDAVFQQLYHS